MKVGSSQSSQSLSKQSHCHDNLTSEAATMLAHFASVAGVMSPSASGRTTEPATPSKSISGASTTISTNLGGTEDMQIPPIPKLPTHSFVTAGTPKHLDSMSASKDAPAEKLTRAQQQSIAEIIKDSVLRRLNHPEDIVKRNMFAVEGKSIKFPVKVRHHSVTTL